MLSKFSVTNMAKKKEEDKGKKIQMKGMNAGRSVANALSQDICDYMVSIGKIKN
jgi:hypothetical protein